MNPSRQAFLFACLTTLVSIETASPLQAEVKLPSIFGDHMVLQQEAKVPVWGTADPNEKITVTVGDHTATTTTGTDGKWRVNLHPFPNGVPATTMTVSGKNTVTFQDVLVGDVWVASGQSNMWYTLGMAANAKTEVAQATEINKATDPQLRLFLVSQKTSLQPVTDVFSPFFWKLWPGGKRPNDSEGDHPGTWVVCSPHLAETFSAVAYFFGKELRSHLNRPIGLIGDYWPGTTAEVWISLDGLQKEPPFKSYIAAYQQNLANFPKKPGYDQVNAAYLAAWKDREQREAVIMATYEQRLKAWTDATDQAQKSGQPAPPPLPPPDNPPLPSPPTLPDGANWGPANLFNGMIAPIIPYAIKGVIWYQGESSIRAKAPEYRLLFPRLIADWREKWGQGDFPFLYVQISHNGYAGDQTPALVREAQLMALSQPHTGMAVTVDIPCDEGVHPYDKTDPGHRLALAARHVAYGEDLVYSGPIYRSMKVEGPAIRIGFTQVGGGLIIGQTPYQPPPPAPSLPTDKLVGFTIAGADKKFVPADAKIDGNTVIVFSPGVPSPVAVRFAWGDVVQDNLYNKENLPASPFRTDAWTEFTYAPLTSDTVPPSFGPEILSSMPPQTK